MAVTDTKSIKLSCQNYSNCYTLEAGFEETSTDTANNKSAVYVRGSLITTTVNWADNHDSWLNVYWHDNRDNTDR